MHEHRKFHFPWHFPTLHTDNKSITIMNSIQHAPSINLSSVSYPRTGKRGVPQQFARRLYEMLQSETKLALESPQADVLIKWSDSGLAFRIIDVKEFTSLVLPKYFRTKKFSSFQRNLNLVSRLAVAGMRSVSTNTFSDTDSSLTPVIHSTAFPKFDEGLIPTCTHTLPLCEASPSF